METGVKGSQLEKALWYAEKRGWRVLPIHSIRNKACTCGKKGECDKPGKHPRWNEQDLAHGAKSASTDPDLIRKWWKRWPDANVGIATGAGSFDVLDVDLPEGPDALLDLAKGNGGIPDTIEQITGGGGRQIFFQYTGGKLANDVKFAPGLDIRTDGGLVVVPPSRHISGNTYEWEASSRPEEKQLAPMPGWLIEAIEAAKTPGAGNGSGVPLDIEKIFTGLPQGERDQCLFKYACRLRNKNLDRKETEALILVLARSCKPPFSEEDALKKVESAWKYPPGQAEDNDAQGKPGLSTRIEEMNRNHAVIMVGGKCVVMNEVIDPTFNRPDITFSAMADLKNFYRTDKIAVSSGEVISVASVWLESPKRRQYKGLVFSPGENIPGHFNLWRGFAVQPKKGNWSLNRNHIYEVICGGNEQCDEYLIAWMADIAQRAHSPKGDKPGVAVVLKGGRGIGKGTFAQAFGGIFGSHFLHVTSPNQFIGRFNQHLKDCLVLFADEAFWAGDKTGEGILKALITEPTIRVEPKGKDSFSVKNHVNIIMASNNDWVVPAGIDERRFLVLEVGNDHQQDHEYFRVLHTEMNNGGREAMLYDLLKQDLAGANLRGIPQTTSLFEQKLLSADSVTKFWFSRLEDGTQLREDNDWNSFTETQKLYDQYVRYAQNLGFARVEDNALFARKIWKLCPGIRGPRRFSVLGRRVYAIEFPDLSNCREQFEHVSKCPIQWPTQEED